MADETLNEEQKLAVEALIELKRICDKHNLKLFLIAGTCLGAVRHKGMIPWDDDIDVGLLYDDWHKLRKILPKELNGRFEYVDDEIENTWPRFFGKILYNRKSCVDIFLIAKWTDDPVSARIHWSISKIARDLYYKSINYHIPFVIRPEWSTLRRIRRCITPAIKKILYFIPHFFFNRNDCIRLARWNDSFFEGKEANCYINIYSVYSMNKETLKSEWIENVSQVEFEGESYNTVGDTDAYLTHLYGDYMTPPPAEKQVCVHGETF